MVPPLALHDTVGFWSVLPSLSVANAPYCLDSPASRLALVGQMVSEVTVGTAVPLIVTLLVSATPAGIMPITMKAPEVDPAV